MKVTKETKTTVTKNAKKEKMGIEDERVRLTKSAVKKEIINISTNSERRPSKSAERKSITTEKKSSASTERKEG